ncbi:glucose-1-phosphate adenylyltransferase [Halochromatium glycolicum]|jgi:glucose-1-phosphate adenylyltransferase|uniref:Glucose-1-phosphate adenylyltransferase n=1 Tax=Halochromatium glycolicum TaxID=85075 RepID=A0AAJ0U3P0_9GAMM|nr:glucose-1-phosphate adenylyltransferase [Halochromatium glycolicum]MBK1704232.1 glucose-1-phosphate adenylyltransferase [Halochromatium glycolicum]
MQPTQSHADNRNSIMAMVMAGGQGSRLRPLTDKRSKPAVPFGSRYRIIDFVLSNLVNSGISTIYLLVQYKSQSLIEHVRKAWTISPLFPDQFVTVVPPQMLNGKTWFTGTADAVAQNLELIESHHPDLVLVFGADHVYRMDVGRMIEHHLEHDADVTVAALPVAREESSSFGVIVADSDGRVRGFEEKPAQGTPIPDDPSRVYASMGNYVFRAGCLVRALRDAQRNGETDFGSHVLPRMLAGSRVFAYDFADNRVPGVKSYEEQAYWRDVGTIDAYYAAHQDVLGAQPILDLFNPRWPVFSSNYQGPVARVMDSEIDNSLLGAATLVEGARVCNSIVRREAVIEEGAEIEDSIIMDYARVSKGARLRRVIVDRHNLIERETSIGWDLEQDRASLPVTDSGIVVVPRGRTPFFARGPRGGGGGYSD